MDDNTRDWARKAALAPPAGRFTSYGDAQEQVLEFERILREHRIEITPGSELERACLRVLDLYSKQQDPALRTGEDERESLRDIVGLVQLVQLVLRRRSHPDFPNLVPHLALLNDGSPAQNTLAPPHDQASNKLFELLVALAAMECGTNVRLDSPSHADGKNPDVLADMIDGRRWGLACKVLHGDAPMTLFERIAEGVAQIERSDAETGIVVLNFKNRLPHNDLFPAYRDGASGEHSVGVYVHPAHPATLLATFVQGRTTAMADEVGKAGVVGLFSGRKALPGVLVVAQAAVAIRTDRGVAPSMVGFVELIDLQAPEEREVFDRLDEGASRVVASLNEALQLR